MRLPMRLFVLALLGILCGGLVTGCTTNPATGERSLTFLSWDREIAMGLEAAPGMTSQFGGEVADSETQMYVDEVGQRLLMGIEEGVPELPWEFTLLDSSVINAFALPGGQVYLSRGLADKLSSEAEMAGVIGHEIGHVTARHGNQRITKQLGFNGVIALAALVVGAAEDDSSLKRYGELGIPAISMTGGVVLLKYGRDEEIQADMLGVRYMSRAGYDPVGQRRVMEVLRAASSGQRQPEWLSTHPASNTRIKRINQLLANEYAYTQNSSEYVTNEAEYQRRMLGRLSQLGAPAHGATTNVGMLGNSSLWCAHCNPALAMSE